MSSKLRVKFLVGAMMLCLPSVALANCKWFKVGGFSPGATVVGVVSSEPGCLQTSNVPTVVNGAGFVTFEVCTQTIFCSGCPSDVIISVLVEGGPAADVPFQCAPLVIDVGIILPGVTDSPE